MKSYDETIKICEKFYTECVRFWNRENHAEPAKMALDDVSRLEFNPFSPNGEKLDKAAVNGFVKSK